MTAPRRAQPLNPLRLVDPGDDDTPEGLPEIGAPHFDQSLVEGDAYAQSGEAMRGLTADPSTFVRFPWRGVDEIVRPIRPGRLVFVTARTGQGKSTFIRNAIDAWWTAGRRVYVLGTEQTPDEWRTLWACLRAGVDPSLVEDAAWDEHPNGAALKAAVSGELSMQRSHPAYDRVYFSPVEYVSPASVLVALNEAYEFKADVLVIDHIDHGDHADDASVFAKMSQIVRPLRTHLRRRNLVGVVTSQLNRAAMQTGRLAAYSPPQAHHMQFGGTKEQVADRVLGVWRPLLPEPAEPALAKEHRDKLKAAAAGHIEPVEVLEPNTMAVGVLKNRQHGHMDGRRCKLAMVRGKLADLPSRDLHGASEFSHGRSYDR